MLDLVNPSGSRRWLLGRPRQTGFKRGKDRSDCNRRRSSRVTDITPNVGPTPQESSSHTQSNGEAGFRQPTSKSLPQAAAKTGSISADPHENVNEQRTGLPSPQVDVCPRRCHIPAKPQSESTATAESVRGIGLEIEGKYSVELFKEGGEGAGQEEIIDRHDNLTVARAIYRGRVSQYPGRLVMLCDRARVLARSDRPETMS